MSTNKFDPNKSDNKWVRSSSLSDLERRFFQKV